MMMMMNDPVANLFNHPLFRKGWFDARGKVPWDEEQANNLIYVYGRLIAIECNPAPIPPPSNGGQTPEMEWVLAACPEFTRMLHASAAIVRATPPQKGFTQ